MAQVERGATSEDVLQLHASYACGPSDADGLIRIERLSFARGATRPLDLVIMVDGIEAELSASSYWSNSSTLMYFNAEQVC